MSNKTINFDGSWQNYLMRNGKFTVGFNMPNAIKGDGSHSLPPYAKRMPFLVDEYPSCPSDWMRSEGKIKSFFVPVEEGKGMWLDLNNNTELDRHVAVVISIQGINPITGLPCKDAQLEQYIDTCPKHNIKFGADRYCKKCKFNWPKQNYLATTATPQGLFWLDGFKTADGIVRQYLLTAEKMRGVASNLIGKDRVYAIGLSFFLSKEKKPESSVNTSILRSLTTYNNYYIDPNPFPKFTYTDQDHTTGNPSYNTNVFYCCDTSNSSATFGSNSFGSITSSNVSEPRVINKKKSLQIKTKNLEIAAGSKINQSVYDDPENLDYWHSEPESIICISYCIESEALKIIESGKEEIENHPEGFLQGIPVGN